MKNTLFLQLLIVLGAHGFTPCEARERLVFQQCGDYEAFGVIHCNSDTVTLTTNPRTHSEKRIQIKHSPVACQFYPNQPLRLQLKVLKLEPEIAAVVIETSLHLVIPESMITPPTLRKESPCE